MKAVEREIPNPGGKRCKRCGGLITGPIVVRSGCSNRHPECDKVKGKFKKESGIKSVNKFARGRVRKMTKLGDES